MYALRNNVSQLVDPDVNMLLNLFDKMVTHSLGNVNKDYETFTFKIGRS